ncbi:hypothetical protein ARMGADRAFT_1010823 [Armillaria gallica]|uniref:Uncharacterized protein n=1 Tax=Armillaria gallica TaxID=47427 RepID=A0A2H3DL24_ARMGA|nr:hypothetical protein ARMGADRAFT_1010823 [Armillaria gallica]
MSPFPLSRYRAFLSWIRATCAVHAPWQVDTAQLPGSPRWRMANHQNTGYKNLIVWLQLGFSELSAGSSDILILFWY